MFDMPHVGTACLHHQWHETGAPIIPGTCPDIVAMLSAAAGAVIVPRWTKKLMGLVAAKGEKMAVNIQGPYCELPGPGPILGHCEGLSAARTRTADGIIIVAGEDACGQVLMW